MNELDENTIAKIIQSKLKLSFSPFQLRTKQDPTKVWGKPDRHLLLGRTSHLFLEVDTAQKHPNTNVVKYWPWLEENPDHHILLIQVFNKKPERKPPPENRRQLCEWYGRKIEAALHNRFRYMNIIIGDEQQFEQQLPALHDAVASFQSIT